jgi:hypothetical protein
LAKINPKNFQRRRANSQTFGDWNREEDPYSRVHRKGKSTILDEFEDDYYTRETKLDTIKTTIRNARAEIERNVPKLDGSENVFSAAKKITEGNQGALVELLKLFNQSEDDWSKVSILLTLDTHRIYGHDVETLCMNCKTFEKLVYVLDRKVRNEVIEPELKFLWR